MAEISSLENILNNPGLIHLAENIFGNLEDVKFCRDINQSSKQILDNPMFWLQKFGNLSKDNQKDWINVIQSETNSEMMSPIISYLQWNLKKNSLVDLPCYTNSAVQEEFRRKIRRLCMKPPGFISDFDKEMIKNLVPLTDNPNAPNENGVTPIYMAAHIGNTEIVKILAPLTANPNAPDKDGDTPILWAAHTGSTEIVKILAPLTANPNTPNKDGDTPIFWAACYGHTEIVKILAPFTNNPNAPNKKGQTPCTITKNTEIKQILKSSNTP